MNNNRTVMPSNAEDRQILATSLLEWDRHFDVDLGLESLCSHRARYRPPGSRSSTPELPC
ncbi:hypothetical protein ElP_71860 (plasmid) [Tautonia plasticadhaerens]|uniref:Uncharacterized protein n=1 Tax=Tautonia plasticadhaerens TaxID=2527974 RepID=A0A518HEF4_9BACT|nr:hypothetical protein ElP_71860 [Tautonia plasticadhaerens]